MAKAHRLPGVRTDPAALKSLPQFQTDASFDIDHVDSATGEYRAFSSDRQAELIQLLTGALPLPLQKIDQEQQKGRLVRFLKTALSAIATYEHRQKEQADFDRAAARKIILAAHKAVSDAHSALLRVASDAHLSRFLEQLFVHQKPEPVLSKTYRDLGPKAVAGQLFRLEPVLFLAAERLAFQPGDIQRDDIARTFTDVLASAWMEATGKIPSYAQPSARTRNPSLFGALLAVVNEVLPAAYRSSNDFRDYARASIKQLKLDFPNAVKGNPSSRKVVNRR